MGEGVSFCNALHSHGCICGRAYTDLWDENDKLKLQNQELQKQVDSLRRTAQEAYQESLEIDREHAEELATRDRLYREAVQKGEALCRATGNLLLAAMKMVKHQQNRHEHSSCCTDVTPTPTYELQQAIEDFGRVSQDFADKRNHEDR